MGISTPTMSGMTGLRATSSSRSGGFGRIKQVVGAVGSGRLLRLAAKELVLQGTDLALGLAKFPGQLRVALEGVAVHDQRPAGVTRVLRAAAVSGPLLAAALEVKTNDLLAVVIANSSGGGGQRQDHDRLGRTFPQQAA